MASGSVHTLTTLCASAVGISYYGLDNIPASSAWLLGGLWCTIVQPDLDVDDGFYGLTVLNKTKDGLGTLWQLYWRIYSKLIPHRSFISHAPFVGTFGRLLYGGWYFLPLLTFWDGTPFFITAIIAFDILHWVLDWKLWSVFRLFRQ